MTTEILTIGHSTRSMAEFLALLQEHHVALLVDVRRFPASRRHPHFAREALSADLGDAGVGYVWLEALGGRRTRRPGSPHTAWQVAGFAAYADHMESDGFLAAGAELLRQAGEQRTVVMCAEAHPSQCHRRLLSDWLTVQSARVLHVIAAGRTEPHTFTPFARVDGQRLVYDGGQPGLFGGATEVATP